MAVPKDPHKRLLLGAATVSAALLTLAAVVADALDSWIPLGVAGALIGLIWLVGVMMLGTDTIVDSEELREVRALAERLPTDVDLPSGDVFLRIAARHPMDLAIVRVSREGLLDAHLDLQDNSVSTLSYDRFSIGGDNLIARHHAVQKVRRGDSGLLETLPEPDPTFRDLFRYFRFVRSTRALQVTETEIVELRDQLRRALGS